MTKDVLKKISTIYEFQDKVYFCDLNKRRQGK